MEGAVLKAKLVTQPNFVDVSVKVTARFEAED
jgi:hypothetical protein